VFQFQEGGFVMSYLKSLWYSFFEAIPGLITAILLLLLAWVVATIARNLVVKLLKKSKAEKYTNKVGIVDETTGSSVDFIGKLVFIVVFILFLPGVLDKLGMQNVSAPIALLASRFLNFIPNLIAAGIILVVGIFVAKIIRQLLTPVLKRLNVDKLQEKSGLAASEGTKLSSLISYVVYVLILIMVIIAALQVLNISAISLPAVAMLNKILLFLPNIFVAIAIVIIGVFIAKLVGKLLTEILSGVGADGVIKKIVTDESSKLQQFSLSKAVGAIVKYIIILLFAVEAINVLNLEVLEFAGEAIISYLPFAVSAVIIIGAALLLATWVEGLIKKHFPHAGFSALAAKCIIIVLASFMTLNQLGIATYIVNAAFIIVLSAFAVAFAVAFGIGGRESAAKLLKKFEGSMNAEPPKDKNE